MAAPNTTRPADTMRAEAKGRAIRAVPLWTIAAFGAAMIAAYFATVVYVFGIHGDYEQLLYKSSNPFLFNDTLQALSIARPVLVLLSNIPLAPMHTIADFRWARAFSILTVWFLGSQLILICIRHLRIPPLLALMVATATFLVPDFAFSIMNLASWGPHLVSIGLAFCAYLLLSATNVDAFLLRNIFSPLTIPGLVRHSFAYATSKRFLGSSALLLIAMYNYPTNSLIVCLFPILTLLFSTNSRTYRLTIAFRDIVFIVFSLAVYMVTTKQLYFPLVTKLYGLKPFPSQGPGSEYRFAVQLDPLTVLARFGDALRVSANLWFLPQSRFYLASAFLILCTTGLASFVTSRDGSATDDTFARLKLGSWKADGTAAFAALVACYLLALAPVLYSIGGFVDYRTIVVATALTATLVVYALWASVGKLAGMVARQPDRAGLWAGALIAAFMLISTGIAAADIDATVRLARQELAYAGEVTSKAVHEGAKTLVVIDPRVEFLPNDYPVAEDREHRAILPYALGCFSTVCLSLGGIFDVAAQQAGLGTDPFAVEIFRGGAARSVTCDLFSETAALPATLDAATAARIDEIRARGVVTCTPFEFTWLDVRGRAE